MTRTHPEPQDAPPGKSKDIVVFIIRRDTKCAECGEELGSGRWIRVENDKALCMTCADLAHLEYLPSGNTALTRRGREAFAAPRRGRAMGARPQTLRTPGCP